MSIDPGTFNNLTAVAAPGITDDRDSQYTEGSRWINVITSTGYKCIDATVGEARWVIDELASIASIAGLSQALGDVPDTLTRTTITEDFSKRPALAAAITLIAATLTDNSGKAGGADDTLAAHTAQKANYAFLLNPAAATTTGGADQLDISGGAGAMANIVQPDQPRNIVINFTDGDTGISAFQVDVVGVAPDGTATSEQFVFAGGLDQVGSVVHATITSVTLTSITGNGAGDLLDVGYGSKLGVSLPAGSTGLGIVKLKVAGASEAAAATDTTNNSFTATTALDGAKDIEVWYEYIDAQDTILAQNVSDVAAKVMELFTLINGLTTGNADFEVAGTNMTTALVTHNAVRGGIRLTTAGANNDQCFLQPRLTNSGDSRWATGYVTDQKPSWSRSFRLPSVADFSVKHALGLTNAHDLTTDADQVGLFFSTGTGGNFLVVTSINGSNATIDTGVAPAADTEYRLRIEIQADRTAHVYINDERKAITPALKTGINLLPFSTFQALTASAKSIDIRDSGSMSMEEAA